MNRNALTKALPDSRKNIVTGTKSPAFSEKDRLTHLIRETDKRLIRALQLRLSKHKVAHGHWIFLRVLWEKDGLTQTELSRLVGVMNPSTSAAVRTMEHLGYVIRRQKCNNKKKVFIHLTPFGRSLEQKLVPLAIQLNDCAARGLSKLDIRTVRETLIAVMENLDEDSANWTPPD